MNVKNMRVTNQDIEYGMQELYYGFTNDITENNLKLGKCALFLYREWQRRNPGQAMFQMDFLELQIKQDKETLAE